MNYNACQFSESAMTSFVGGKFCWFVGVVKEGLGKTRKTYNLLYERRKSLDKMGDPVMYPPLITLAP